MTEPARASISAAVEGDLDDAVVRRVIGHVGGKLGTVYGKNGDPFLKERIAGYNHAARHSPWLVLIDLDTDADCAPPLRTMWLPCPAPQMCFRVAVRAVEAWLIADAETLARFLRVAPGRVPQDPEGLPHPKEAIVNLARRSRRRAVRQDMVPHEGSGRAVGRAYTSRVIEYIQEDWRPDVAADHAESLQRAIRCLRRLGSEDAAGNTDAGH